MKASEAAVDIGRTGGAFAALAYLADVQADEAADAYNEAMKSAYWEHGDLPLAMGLAFGGVSRLLRDAAGADDESGYRFRSAVKAMTYNLASFAWPGWDQDGVEISENEAAAGLAAARMNLTLAQDLEKGDLPESRAHWMIGAHLLTAGDARSAADAFAKAKEHAAADGTSLEDVRLNDAFWWLASAAAGEPRAHEGLAASSALLAEVEHGDELVGQVTTVRRILGL